jgi:hypothetical protein
MRTRAAPIDFVGADFVKSVFAGAEDPAGALKMHQFTFNCAA